MTTITSVEQRKTLKVKGLKKKDIDLALRLKNYIENIDKIIFPNFPARILLCRKASRRNFKATYTLPSGGGDYYTVFVKGLHKNLVQEKEAGLVMTVKKDGRIKILPHSRPLHSFTPLLIAIACHEVRHRMQSYGKIKFFTQELPKEKRSKLLEYSLHYVEILFNILRKDSKRSNKKKQNLVKSQTSRSEVDAMTVETMILHSLGSDNQTYIPLLRLGTRGAKNVNNTGRS